jgi:hypothetical protein
MPWVGLKTHESLTNGFQSLSQALIAFELFEMPCSRGRQHQRE